MRNEEQLVRLNKYLKDMGIASRRACDVMIANGQVKVNGKIVTEMGIKVDPDRDKILVDSKVLEHKKQPPKVLMLYKPRGFVCTTSEKEGRSVYSLLPRNTEGFVCIGRLDKNSEGLLLFSNDGELVYELSHPSFGHTKTYQVTVSGILNREVLKSLNDTMEIDGYHIKPAKVFLLRPSTRQGRYVLAFVLKEGRKRQIRKMCEAMSLEVHRLVRTHINHLSCQGLKAGEFKWLKAGDIKTLKKMTE